MDSKDSGESQANEKDRKRRAFLFNNKLLSDIEFRFGDGVNVIGHKTILSAASHVFHEKFYGHNATTKKTLYVSDDSTVNEEHFYFPWSADTLIELLRFIYTNTMNLSLENIPAIMDAASLFKLKGLEKFVFDYIFDKRLSQHVIVMYEKCFNSGNNLTKHCLTLFDSFFHGISEEPDFLIKMTLKPLLEIIKRDSLTCPEIIIFKALVKWSRNMCKQQRLPTDGKSLRNTFPDLFQLVRFPIMAWEEFLDCKNSVANFFTPGEINDLFSFIRHGVKKESLKFSTIRRNEEIKYRIVGWVKE